jgi:hypothetical protein
MLRTFLVTSRMDATETGKRNFRELLSAWVEHVLLNGAAQIEETALPFPQYALLNSVTCVQLWLITILGNFGCVAVASFLGVLPPLCYTMWVAHYSCFSRVLFSKDRDLFFNVSLICRVYTDMYHVSVSMGTKYSCVADIWSYGMCTRKADCVIAIVSSNIRELISISFVWMTSPDEASSV